MKIGRSENFLQRFKIEKRIYEYHYRCIDKKKNLYRILKIINKKGLTKN